MTVIRAFLTERLSTFDKSALPPEWAHEEVARADPAPVTIDFSTHVAKDAGDNTNVPASAVAADEGRRVGKERVSQSVALGRAEGDLAGAAGANKVGLKQTVSASENMESRGLVLHRHVSANVEGE